MASSPEERPPRAALRNVLAVIVGASACLILNSLLLGVLMGMMTLPEGFDPEDLATFGLLQPQHYMVPFVAHAVPSAIGGLIAAAIAATRKLTFAVVVGGLHMVGGIAAAFLIPAPAWFVVLDLTVAYLPMAALGGRLGARLGGTPAPA